ncbi:2718_t:CDS:2 [Cetraspora pellucida]|uniref:2718_t:CDS:1 n=1 Tax=Cetraspora pellucida TaxID=1433469 RepID=A0A9N9IG78_9GLOM|nr:2718_t:CDS:2 [Cetraspora pellucida]
MIEKLHRIHDITDILVTLNPSFINIYLTNTDWQELDMLVILLELIYLVTNFLFSSSYPTLENLHEKKLDKYWDKLKTTFNEAVILDPNNKLMLFDNEKKETSYDYFHKKYGVFINHDDILKEYLDLPEEINILDYWKTKSKNSQ